MIARHLQGKLAAFCVADRDRLLCGYCERHGIAVGESFPWDRMPVPARMLDDILMDLGYRIVSKPMPDHILGCCDFDRRRILVNTRTSEITMKGTCVAGVVNFTKAHELAHVRFPDHERQLREAAGVSSMLSLFEEGPVEPATMIVCNRSGPGQGPRPFREEEADFYASQFLVPSEMLAYCEAACRIEAAWRAQQEVPSRRLWADVLAAARHFEVTGTVMQKRLVQRGWIVLSEDRKLSISPELELF